MSAASPFELLEGPVPHWPLAEVGALLSGEYGLHGELTTLDGERDQNLLLESLDGRFTIKIANDAEPREVLEMQQAALEHLAQGATGLATPIPRRAVDGSLVTAAERDGARSYARVQSFVEGTLLRDLPPGSIRAYDIGVAVARLQRGLQGFFHPAAGRRILWDVRRAPLLGNVIAAIDDSATRQRVVEALARYEASVAAVLEALPAQIIHNDMNPDNVVVTDGAVTGVIDFGDMVHGPRVMGLAVAAAYQLPDGADPGAVLTEMAAGYESVSPLTDDEVAVLRDLVEVRVCQSIAIGAWHAGRHPDNADYILGDARSSRRALLALDGLEWPLRTDKIGLRERRSGVIAPGLRLSYDEPLHLVSGDGVWLEDAAGRRYLDAYNNVVQVGHGHPLVARATARQTRRLNTNTRYLTDALVDYAERLTALLPDGLDVCYFTNSGSEANDLAWRIARAVTGNEGAIVTDFAYHGSTGVVAAMSPEELGERPLEPWVATVPPPGGHDPAAAAAHAVKLLASRNIAPAALLFDTIFSSDGIFDPPGEFIEGSVGAARGAAALFIADEVQAGLGRVGERFWGFAAGSAIPDIVTLGKPIGNGHPIGAVVTTKEIAGTFAERDYFFSTFGGNTVSAAVGTAVLEITARERLAEQAEDVGSQVRAGIDGLGIGEVRGAGLFIGVEIADAAGRPDAASARRIVEGMKERGVLVGRTGRHDNVIKIRPPLVFGREHATVLLEALEMAAGRPAGTP